MITDTSAVYSDKPTDMSEAELAGMAALLENSGRYRVLRRLETRSAYCVPDGTPTRRAVYLDVETTGLDHGSDEIIELALLPFDFSSDGRIFGVGEAFERYRDPGRPIPPGVTALTGISDEMVAGKSIDPAELEAFLGDTVLVIAHNAKFDRIFAERFCSAFDRLDWACSWTEVNWHNEGFTDGAKLVHLACASGFFFDSHRAVNDCRAGLELLSRQLPNSGRYGLDLLLDSARQPRWRLWATNAPFEMKDVLKRRGYRWNDGTDGRPKAWFTDVTADQLEAERDFLASRIYGHSGMSPMATRVDASDRYSIRS